MNKYHKIDSIYTRDNRGKIEPGRYCIPAFEYLADCQWDGTEKIDGTNVRIHWNGKTVILGGKDDNSQMPVSLIQRLQEMFYTPEVLSKFAEKFPDGDATLFGEGYGAGIQKGGGNYKADGMDFVLFDVEVGPWMLERHNVEDVATFFDIRIVPIVFQGTLKESEEFVRSGFISCWGQFPAEGLVLRPAVELKTRAGDRIITKIKTKDFKP